MRWLVFILVIGSAGAADAPRVGKFTLKNGDRIDITMHGYTLAGGFSFSHADITGKLRIKADALRQVDLNPAPTPAAARRHGALVHLFNGDELAGDIIKLTEESLEFDTWYAGKLSIPRAEVQWLVPGTGAVVFDGPKSLNGWGAAIIGVLLGDDGDDGVEGITIQDVFADSPASKAGLKIGDIITHINGKAYIKKERMIAFVKGQKVGDKLKVNLLRGENEIVKVEVTLGSLHWEFDNGSLISKGTGYVIGKELNWPSMASVDFDLEWDRDIAMDVMLCTDRLHSVSFQNAYLLRLNGGPSYLYRHSSAGEGDLSTTSLGSGNPAWGSARKAHVSIRVDRRTATIALLVNDRLVRKWVDKAGFAGKGKVLQFNPQTDSRMAIHNLRLSEWNGRLPKAGGPPAAQAGVKDNIQFHKGDALTGQIIGVANGKLTLKTDFADLAIPLQKIANISFAKAAPASALNASVLNLGKTGKFYANLLEWSPNGVRVDSPVLGELKLVPSIINSVQFK
ncbi:MAG: PDZ domain-containing protein [Verrucomicrobia subdivision 3 bacterium]|nr:PDZ domain-containing protein [Limisphaerales bacterium]